MEASRHGGIVRPVVLSICFRRPHLRIAAHGVWHPAGGRLCHAFLPMTSTAARDVPGLLDQRDGVKHAWMQIFDELRASRRLICILSMDGVSDWSGAPRLYSRMPRFSAASYTSSAIPSATSHASRECIHEAAEAHFAVPSTSSRARQEFEKLQDRLAGLSRRGQRMGKQFLTRRAVSITMAVPCV